MKGIPFALADVVAHLGTDLFADALIDTLGQLIPFDTAAIFAFENTDSRPICLASRTAPVHGGVVCLYVDHYFHRCEVISRLIRTQSGPRPVVFRLCKADIVDRQYRQDLYDASGIGFELSLLTQVDGMFFFLGLYRSADGRPYNRDEEDRAREFWPFVLNSLIKNARLSNSLVSSRMGAASLVARLVDTFESYGISRREAEVCGHIISGYSAPATALILEISVNTVSTLRQRAYRKLNISCQNELYSLCLQRMGDRVRGGDLRALLHGGLHVGMSPSIGPALAGINC
jgi:DNA-binding CsgD family transcriptional regulator